jgi:ABC-type lipoprotein export system ATPase subunit
MVTHDEHVARHARRILRLQDGALVADVPVAEPLDAQAVLNLDAVLGASAKKAAAA